MVLERTTMVPFTIMLSVASVVTDTIVNDTSTTPVPTDTTRLQPMTTGDAYDTSPPRPAFLHDNETYNDLTSPQNAANFPSNLSDLPTTIATSSVVSVRPSLPPDYHTSSSSSPSSTVGATAVTSQQDMYQVVHLSHERFLDCVNSEGARDELSFTIQELTLLFNLSTSNNSETRYCDLILTSPPEEVVHLQIHNASAVICQNLYISFTDITTLNRIRMLVESSCSLTEADKNVYTLGNVGQIRIMLTPDAAIFINITVRAVPYSARPNIELVPESPFRGYVQTPGWGQRYYAKAMDSKVELKVPEGHQVMISLQHLSLPDKLYGQYCYDRIMLYRDRMAYKNLIWILCEEPRPPPTVYDTDLLVVRFVSDTDRKNPQVFTGFHLLYTYHPVNALPDTTSDGRWNCSVPYWPKFKEHFLCNVNEDCVNGEDEEECPYFSEDCGKGRVRVGKKCYVYFKPNTTLSWDAASVQCLLREGILASPKTVEEWNGIGKLVDFDSAFGRLYIGLRSTSPTVPFLYRRMWQFSDGTIGYYLNIKGTQFFPACSNFVPTYYKAYGQSYTVDTIACNRNYGTKVICEVGNAKTSDNNDADVTGSDVILSNPDVVLSANTSLLACPLGHFTHALFACDVKSSCFQDGHTSASCSAPLTPLPPAFMCDNGMQSVPYTLVCDHRSDCSDDSDENFCVFPPCNVDKPFQCGNRQCLPQSMVCDNKEDCTNSADEAQCRALSTERADVRGEAPPAIVEMDGEGSFHIVQLDNETWDRATAGSVDYCPETHFRCPGRLTYCMPIFQRCNGIYDCPGHEDEVGCDSYTCPGFYRCRGSRMCVHLNHTRDGVFHCPEHDDELLLDATCPSHCVCYGTAFFCTEPVTLATYPDLRYLNADHIAMTPVNSIHIYLVYLSLVNCSLTIFENVSFPNLRSLDLSDNALSFLDAHQLSTLPNLRVLSVAGNPLQGLFSSRQTTSAPSLPSLLMLDLSRVLLPDLNVSAVRVFPNLQAVNLSQCEVQQIIDSGFQPLRDLRVLDLRGSPVNEFPRDVLKGLCRLESVHADNYKLCCPATLPEGFYASDCLAPSNEISSCEALLRSDLYRIFLSVFAFLALCGNLGSFMYRVFISKVSSKLGFDVFVTHLCVSDFAMGLYLAIIGVADRLYQGTYLWNDVLWKNSAACKMAGFLSMLSSEVSAFIICLITLDRFLVLRFPFSHQLHFKRHSAQIACCAAWVVGAIIAAVPLLPVTSHWQFYSQTGICIPLPVTRKDFPGRDYSFTVMIAFNFLLFLLIAAGQLSIYLSVRANSMAVNDSTKKSQDLAIAQRLITIAVSDFLCWFPIGLLGLMAATGRPIPGEVNVAIVIFVLPFNSALNPFLYTLNLLLERRRREREKRLLKMLLSQERSTKSTVAETDKSKLQFNNKEACTLLTQWLNSGLLSQEQVTKMTGAVQKQDKAEI